MNSMNRCFVSRIDECKGNCGYCFGKWRGYIKFPNPQSIEDNTILYPNCDGDVFDGHFHELAQYIRQIKSKGIIISISTKFDISDDNLQLLQQLNDGLKKENDGMLKLSVSFSCKDGAASIEPRTAPYWDRIKLAGRIVGRGIPYVTIIKPILPFIGIEEYRQIVDDTVAFSPCYVLGDLYVDPESEFFKKYIDGRYPVHEKAVSWNGDNGIWLAVDNEGMKDQVREYIGQKNGICFESDRDAIEYLKKKIEEEP